MGGNLKWFNQTSFQQQDKRDNLADQGMIYVPKACEGAANQCDVHLNFHGCGFDIDAVFIMLTSVLTFNNWADTNKIVMIYPRTRTSEEGLGHHLTSDQKSGCWNVYGTTGENYAQQSAPQMAAVKRMVDHALSGQSFDISSTDVGDLDLVDILNTLGISQDFFSQSTDTSSGMRMHDSAALTAFALIALLAMRPRFL